MEPIGRVMRHGLPNQRYLDFVGRYLLHRPPGTPSVDPFQPQLSVEQIEGAYVDRTAVEEEACRLDTQIVMGRQGSGKTTLAIRLSTLLRQGVLVVPVPIELAEVYARLDSLSESSTPLSPGSLATLIFDAYWENLLCNPAHRGRFLLRLRQDRLWMVRLRWFYHHLPPRHLEIPEEFELMTWLRASPSNEIYGAAMRPEDMLRELIRFVTSADLSLASAWTQAYRARAPYEHIQVLLDGVEHCSEAGLERLGRDVTWLHRLSLETGRISFKLFAGDYLREAFERIRCVQSGQVTLYALPLWSEDDLRRLLYRRLAMWMPGESIAPTDFSDRRERMAELRKALAHFLDEEGVKTLCRDLGIDYQDLPAQGKTNKLRELIAQMERRDRLSELFAIASRICPQLESRWPIPSEGKEGMKWEPNWGMRIPDCYLTSLARKHLVREIVAGALRV
ncbi:MAG TPA: hypothetical protein ENF52_05845, partial [Chloroflexi bacterium]|nr:hypothetical protein [Chloroflexota bacterium]